MYTNITRGDIYIANLDPVEGSEQGGIRPVLVIQNDIGNLYSPTVIIAPITSKIDKKSLLPTHHLIQSDFLNRESMVLLEQLRTIDKCRLERYLGQLPPKAMHTMGRAIKISVGLINSRKEGESNGRRKRLANR